MKLKSVLVLFIVLAIFSCGKNVDSIQSDVDIANNLAQEVESSEKVLEYVDYLLEYTEGIISIKDGIEIKIAVDSPSFKGINKIDIRSVLEITGVNGEYDITDDGLISFKPTDKLDYNRVVRCKVNFSEAFNDVPEDLQTFDFKVRTKSLNYSVEIGDLLLSPGNKSNNYNLTGVVEFSDWFDNKTIEDSFKATLGGNIIIPKWNHQGNIHNFTINDIERGSSNKVLNVTVLGKKYFKLGSDFNKDIDILPIGTFVLTSHRVESGANKVIVLNFSSSLLSKQQLSSLIQVGGDRNPRVSISGSQLKIYPQNIKRGEIEVIIKKGIKSSARQSLKKDIVLKVVLEQEYPGVEMLGTSGIVTGDKALYFPFKAVSLKSVDIRIIEIFENNLIQYLQDNTLAKGVRNLRRVAKPIFQGSVELKNDNLQVWNRYHIDLNDFIDVNPGAVYQVEISYRRSQSLYGDVVDNIASQIKMKDAKWGVETGHERSNWNYYGDYYYNGNWQDRKDPNKDAYYSDPKKIQRRVVFASNLGIIAKRSDSGDFKVFVTDINSTDFVKQATVTAYNYQQQVITSVETDNEGVAIFDLKGEIPFVISVKRGKDVGYLKLVDGAALSVSTFNTSGERNRDGLKGFLYGERGVWRPGDNIYLNFILEDSFSTIPQGHPIALEVKNSKGAVVYKEIKKRGVTPIYPFTIKTDKSDPTGNWSAQITIGDQIFRKSLMVESIKPNRLKIDLDFGVDELRVDDESPVGELQVNWLHGAPGKNLKAEFDVSYKAIKTTFKGYEGYIFDDPSVKLRSTTSKLFMGSVDELGHGVVPLNLNRDLDSPGKVMVNFSGKAYEEGGNFSVKNLSIPYYPYESFVGLKIPKGGKSRDMLLTDVDHNIDIVTVNSYGEPTSNKNVKVELYKLDWKWWWDQSAYSDVPNFMQKKGYSLVESGTISTTNGRGVWKLNVKYPSWGRYYLKVVDGQSSHSSGRVLYIDWPGWAGRSTQGDGGVSRLLFTTDKERYNIGQDIGLTFPSSPGGKALISIENGRDILSTYWVDTTDKETKTSFKATKEMFPGAYVHIVLIQPKSVKNNDRPLRLYGILPIKIDDSNALLEPVISMPDTLRPNKPFTLTVSEKRGKEFYYTVAIVDDGLLDLTNFKTPNVYNAFFTKEALGVKTWDIYSQIVGDSIRDYGSLLAVGGGGSGADKKKSEVNRFDPVVKVLGPFKLDVGAKKSHKIIMSNYIGSVRTMVIAANNKQYGSVESTTPVKEPLMVLGTLPRVLGPKEKILLPVTVFALDEKIKDVDISVKVTGKLIVLGDTTTKVFFDKAGDKVVYFELRSLEGLGASSVEIVAKGGGHTSVYNIDIDVKAPNPQVVKRESSSIKSGDSKEYITKPWGYKESRSMVLELSSAPPIDLDNRLEFLIKYPHGCIEQTTSKVFPQLFLEDLKDLSDSDKIRIESNINKGINRLKLFVTSSGGLSYWPGESYAHDWGTSYAGHFLIEARRKGYNVPKELLDGWLIYQQKNAREYNSGSDLNQAYRLYTLALYGSPEIGAMNRLYGKSSSLNAQSRWRLAATYGLTGNKEAGIKLISGLSSDITEYSATSSTFGSALRDKAMILETYYILDMDGYKILEDISKELSSNKRISTQTTAYALISASKYASANGGSIEATVELDGKSLNVNTDKSYFNQDVEYSRNVVVVNNGSSRIYSTLTSKGIELPGEEESFRNGLGLDFQYNVPDDELLDTLPSGTNFSVSIKVKNLKPQIQEELALTFKIPSGWEIINRKIAGGESPTESDYDYKDIRDSSVSYYFDLGAGEENTYFIELNASYQGEYYMPTIYVESMYNQEINAQEAGMWVKIVSSN